MALCNCWVLTVIVLQELVRLVVGDIICAGENRNLAHADLYVYIVTQMNSAYLFSISTIILVQSREELPSIDQEIEALSKIYVVDMKRS